MKFDTQGVSVLDKAPVAEHSRLGCTLSEGVSSYKTLRETVGPPINTNLMGASSGRAPAVAAIAHWISASTESIESKFRRLSYDWKYDTGHLSTVSRITEHPSYLGIIAMGEPAIPLILEDLRAEPNHWFRALSSIASEGPHISEHDKGDIRKISEAWLEWGKNNSYIERP